MSIPVFEEYEPALDRPRAGCAVPRRVPVRGLPPRGGGRAAAYGARRALVLFAAAGVALGGAGVAVAAESVSPVSAPALSAAGVPAPAAAPGRARHTTPGTTPGSTPLAKPDPETPQGTSGPLHGGSPAPGSAPSAGALRETTRSEIISRAKLWVSAKVPYSMTKYWPDGYRQDCSGYVSMAWNLEGNEWTGSLAEYGVKITRDELEPGDILLFHNPSDPNKGSHVTIFGGWADDSHDNYLAYEQTPPNTRAQSTPMAYWNNSDRYVAYRYKGLRDESGRGSTPSATTAYPGAKSFGPGANNKYVTQLGRMLVQRGGKRFYSDGPGPRWGQADQRATEAFQLAQGWRGAAADGLPGPGTWQYLVTGQGKDIPPAGRAGAAGPAASAATAPAAGASVSATAGAPAFPGERYFGPGQSNTYVGQLGRQLVKKDFGTYYATGPGPSWSESDRRNVEAFQQAQGWRGSAADGYPGRETWRRLFA
ncbi:peptidoglycan-binding protein [Streptomyces sp. NPDC088725]|uniref:peptidoglycan-binding protein n=1 Tax=Streptomyces sp. NPDC088725 TaxID=3365873 RepID=UPI0037F17040